MLKPLSTVLMAAAMAFGGLPCATAAPRAKPSVKAPVAKPAKASKPSKKAPAPEPLLPLTEGQLAVGERVMHGEIACEMAQSVRIDPTPNHPGHFTLTHNKLRYAVVPHETVSGAVRLEDAKGEVVWIQIPAKSMLLNVKRGQRMADNCLHEQQRLFVADASSSLGIEAPSVLPSAVALTTPLPELPTIMASYGACWQRKARTWWQVELAPLVETQPEPGPTAMPESECQLTAWDVQLVVAAGLVAVELGPLGDCVGPVDASPAGTDCPVPMSEAGTSAP